MIYRLILILLLCCSCSKMELATNTLLVADWSQTRQIAKNPDKYYEQNIILGMHPSEGKVNGYFAACILGNTILHRTLPKKYRSLYQAGLIAVQIGVIQNNYNIGLQVKF